MRNPNQRAGCYWWQDNHFTAKLSFEANKVFSGDNIAEIRAWSAFVARMLQMKHQLPLQVLDIVIDEKASPQEVAELKNGKIYLGRKALENGDVDRVIIAHEYAHALANQQTGHSGEKHDQNFMAALAVVLAVCFDKNPYVLAEAMRRQAGLQVKDEIIRSILHRAV